ncbi:hypothetical protein Droror1_Dr00005897 [Drosera rotundifolia]
MLIFFDPVSFLFCPGTLLCTKYVFMIVVPGHNRHMPVIVISISRCSSTVLGCPVAPCHVESHVLYGMWRRTRRPLNERRLWTCGSSVFPYDCWLCFCIASTICILLLLQDKGDKFRYHIACLLEELCRNLMTMLYAVRWT